MKFLDLLEEDTPQDYSKVEIKRAKIFFRLNNEGSVYIKDINARCVENTYNYLDNDGSNVRYVLSDPTYDQYIWAGKVLGPKINFGKLTIYIDNLELYEIIMDMSHPVKLDIKLCFLSRVFWKIENIFKDNNIRTNIITDYKFSDVEINYEPSKDIIQEGWREDVKEKDKSDIKKAKALYNVYKDGYVERYGQEIKYKLIDGKVDELPFVSLKVRKILIYAPTKQLYDYLNRTDHTSYVQAKINYIWDVLNRISKLFKEHDVKNTIAVPGQNDYELVYEEPPTEDSPLP